MAHSDDSGVDASHSVGEPEVRLAYQDFWPLCSRTGANKRLSLAQFEEFPSLVSKANLFLSKNSKVVIKSIQTIVKKCVTLADIYNGCLIFSPRHDDEGCYIVGLRLWYAVSSHRSTPLQINYINLPPKRLNPGKKHAEFQTLETVVHNFNQKQNTKPLEGKIVTVDTVCLKINKEVWDSVDGDICLDCLSWPDSKDQNILFFLRIFYIVGPTRPDHIGIVDFVPQKVKETVGSTPIYEPFSGLFPVVDNWVRHHDNQCKSAKSIRTLETIYHQRTVSAKQSLMSIQAFFEDIYRCARVTFLRITYTIRNKGRLKTKNRAFYCRTFMPGYIKQAGSFRESFKRSPARYQTMDQLMKFTQSWLNAVGADVMNVEFCGPYWEDHVKKGQVNADSTVNMGEWYAADNTTRVQHKLIYFIRVYFDHYHPEPPIDKLEEVPMSYKDASGGCCML